MRANCNKGGPNTTHTDTTLTTAKGGPKWNKCVPFETGAALRRLRSTSGCLTWLSANVSVVCPKQSNHQKSIGPKNVFFRHAQDHWKKHHASRTRRRSRMFNLAYACGFGSDWPAFISGPKLKIPTTQQTIQSKTLNTCVGLAAWPAFVSLKT